jgi:hypothetical protein
MLGRQCSRGRLGVVVHAGIVDVPGDNAPSAPPPLDTHSSCLHGTVAPVLATPTAIHRQPPVSPTWCGGGAPSTLSSSFPSFFPSSPLSVVEQSKGGKPKWLVGGQQGLDPGMQTLGQSGPREKIRRRALVGWQGKNSAVAPWLWMVTAPLA